ncbi:SAVMC3_10250 family protein [Gordonia sp. SMJS1]|uniref:SAVMC3_10250 family protein n=1 Tax=Gordonia sp. SMJS1 TaxID=3039400 RepID=UPI0024576512|nr:SAVMC3_10250 family protein [Gordonia sp. SMJS1]WGJ88043.1 SAVMC3_10250 family protein [Gordonia sp. SMJS1]
MAQSGPRDYIYVSRQKVDRLAPQLSQSILKQIKSIDVKVMNVGAGVGLADAPGPHIVELAGALDQAIRESYNVRNAADDDLKPGHYIAGTASLGYGVQVAQGNMAADAAVFIGRTLYHGLCLVGSASHMLDRSVPTTDVTACMSEPSAAVALLSAAGDFIDRERIDSWLHFRYGFHCLHNEFAIHEFQLSYLARVHRVVDVSDGPGSDELSTYVIGTPLWVSLDVPD